MLKRQERGISSVKENCIIVQSGGPTPVINNTVIGLIETIKDSDFQGNIYGAIGSTVGLINGLFLDLGKLTSENRYYLQSTPGIALGTSRHNITDKEIEKIIHILHKNDIRFMFYIGGNGSMEVANMINDLAVNSGYNLTVIGIPKSIDNDLLGTDHSPGYGSAAKFLATSVLDMKMDVNSYPFNKSVTIIETMGRNTGWLAGACGIATYENDDTQTLIYLPESPFEINDCIQKVTQANDDKRNTFLIVAEGIKDNKGNLVDENINYDPLNRPILGGVSGYLKNKIKMHTNIKTRAIETSIWQRSNMLLASQTDIEEAFNIGKRAWDYACQGYSGVMIGMVRNNQNSRYEINYLPKKLSDVIGKEKIVPRSWYNDLCNTVTQDFINYIKPLIRGEVFIPMENGLPKYKKIV